MAQGRTGLVGRLAVGVVSVVLALLSGTLTAGAAAAADFSWHGGGTNPDWSTGANWVGGTAPSGAVGTLTFPASACTSASGCQSIDNRSGLTAATLNVDSRFSSSPVGSWELTGSDPLRLTSGFGAIFENSFSGQSTYGDVSVGIPIVLAGANTWSIATGTTLGGEITGAPNSLQVNFQGPFADNRLQIDGSSNEVGPVTLNGWQGSGCCFVGGWDGAVIAGDLNGQDHSSITVNAGAGLSGRGTVGPLNVAYGGAVNWPIPLPSPGLAVQGPLSLAMGATAAFTLEPDGTEASPITATGQANVAGAYLQLQTDPGPNGCDLSAGTVYTLIDATAGLSGTMSDWSTGPISDGTIVKSLSSTLASECSLRINYTADSVTATVVAAPRVTTGAASELTQTTATLNGTVNPGGLGLTDCHFDYGTSSASYALSVPCQQIPSSGNSPVAVSAQINGLTPGTTYHFRLVAANQVGTGTGADATFNTYNAGSPVNSGPPTISGSPVEGNILTEHHGTWSGDPSYSFQWENCDQTGANCAPISGATAQSYKLTNADVGYTIRVVESAANSAGPGGSAVSAPTTVVKPGASAVCKPGQMSEVRFDVIDALGCFDTGPNGTFVSHGPVTVNGVLYTPDHGSRVVIDKPGAVLHLEGSGGAVLDLAGRVVPLLNWIDGTRVPLTKTPQPLFTINANAAKAIHFPLVGQVTGQFVKAQSASGTQLYGVQLTVTASLKPIGSTTQATASITSYNKLGVQALSIEVTPANADPKYRPWQTCTPGKAYVGFNCTSVEFESGNHGWRLLATDPGIVRLGPVALTDFLASFDRASGNWEIQTALAFGTFLPGSQAKDLPTLLMDGKFGPNLASFKAGGSNLDWKLGPFEINGIGVNLQLKPSFAIGGNIDVNVLKDVGFLNKLGLGAGVEVKGGFSFALGTMSGFDLRITGPVPLFDLPIEGYVELDTRNGNVIVKLGGQFSKDFGPAGVNVNVDGAVQVRPSVHVQLTGDGSADAFGQSIGVHVVLSDAGIGACGELHVLLWSGQIGIEHFWAPFPAGQTNFQGCDFSGLYTIGTPGGAHDAAAGQTVIVHAGTPREEFAATGAAGAPSVMLTGPDGTRVKTPASPDKIEITGHTLALAVSAARTTYFIVDHPAAGRWRLTPAGGSQPVRYELADPLRPVHLTVGVIGHGRNRILTWKLRPQRGMTVRFVQSGATVQAITSTTRRAGRVRFAIAPGPAGRRTIQATIAIGGVPRQQLTVAHLNAPGAAPGPRIPRATYRLRSGSVLVTWRRARNAAGYWVTVRLPGGALQYRLPRTVTSAKIVLPPGSRVERVLVSAVSATGITGPVVSATRL